MSHRFHRDDAGTAALDAASRAGGTLADRLNVARRDAEGSLMQARSAPADPAEPIERRRIITPTRIAWALLIAMLVLNTVLAVLP